MYFSMGDTLTKINEEEFIQAKSDGVAVIAILSPALWEEKRLELGFTSESGFDFSSVHFSKIEFYPDYIEGTLSVPNKKSVVLKRDKFAFCIKNNVIALIDDNNQVNDVILKLTDSKRIKTLDASSFLYLLFDKIIEHDLAFLQKFEKDMGSMEDEILKGDLENFNSKAIRLRKNLMRMHTYYDQLIDIGQSLQESLDDYFPSSPLQLYRLFTERVTRLHNNVNTLREYSVQLREIYQAQIDINLNRTMKVLTVVTTIFLPLTLIVGWYGMNFTNMPELTWRYSYGFVIIISIAIVLFCIWFFKKKDFF